MEQLQAIQEHITKLCNPQRFLLFGSWAKRTAIAKSDIYLCIVSSTRNKQALLADLYCDTEADTPIDFLLYTPAEWDQCVRDHQSFAHKLNRKGIVLYS
ncbi:nucleotidyltransferase domain-containing protein [Dysosmobacter welbionis]